MGPLNAAVASASKQQIKIPATVDTSSISGGLTKALSSSKGDFAAVGKELGMAAQMGMTQQFGAMGGAASSFAMALGPVGIAVGAVAVGLGALGAAAVGAAASWESMATSIGRTTGLDGANLEGLMNDLQSLRMEMGVTAQAAASMVEQAGSIGVGQQKYAAGDIAGYKKEILDFTKSTAMLQGAWGMNAEATAQGIGKMGSVTLGAWNQQRVAAGEAEMTWSQYAESVGGKVDSLANTMGSSEEEIVTAMRNSSAAVASFAPTEDTYGKWLALSSFLIDTGSSAGEAGTQIERLAKGAKQHGAELGAILGMDKETFGESLKTDFVGTFQNIAQELASMPAADRPDMIQLLGIEGSGAMDKMIADIESGVDKLNTAIKLDPSNITEGWDNVADDASKAFDRVGEALKVALEKMGGVALPIVTNITNLIADAMVAGIEWGSDAWAGMKENIANADEVLKNYEGLGSLVDWGKALLGIDEEITPEVAEAVENGTADGMVAGAKTAQSGITEVAKESFIDASNAYLENIKNFKGSSQLAGYIAGQGLSDAAALAAYNTQYGTNANEAGNSYTFNILGEQYGLTTMKGGSGFYDILSGPNGFFKSLQSSGEDAAETVAKEYLKNMEGSIRDVGTFMEDKFTAISSEVGQIFADGILTETEELSLKIYQQLLEAFKQEHPLEFTADMEALADSIQGALYQKSFGLNLTAGQIAVNEQQYLTANAGLYAAMENITGYASDEGYISKVGPGKGTQINARAAEIELQQMLLRDNSEELNSSVETIENAIENVSEENLENAYVAIERISELDPGILKTQAMLERIAAFNIVKFQTGLDQSNTSLGNLNKAYTDSDTRLKIVNTDLVAFAEALSGASVSIAASAAASAAASSASAAAASAGSYSPSAYGSYYTSASPSYTTINTGASASYLPTLTSTYLGLRYMAEGGIADKATLGVFGEAGREAFIPLSDRDAGRRMLPQVLKELGIPVFAEGGVLGTGNAWDNLMASSGSGLSGWGSDTHNAVSGVQTLTDNLGSCALSADGLADSCALTATQVKNAGAAAQGVYGAGGEDWLQPTMQLQIESTVPTMSPYMPSPTAGALITGLSSEGYLIQYDPRTETCEGLPFNAPDPSLKTTDPFYLAMGASPLTNAAPTAAAQMAATANASEVSQLASVLGASGFSPSGVSGAAGALVTGLSSNGYVVTYDPRNDTCMGIEFNAPDPSLKTSDPFYLGLTYGAGGKSTALTPVEEGGWGGQVAQTLDGHFFDLSSLTKKGTETTATVGNTIADYIKATNSTVIGIEKTATQQTVLLKDGNGKTQQIIAGLDGVVQAVKTGTNTMNGTLIDGSLVSSGSSALGSNSVPAWFASAAPMYGSTFNDWISGGAAGVGLNPDPTWFTEAVNDALSAFATTGVAAIGSIASAAAGAISSASSSYYSYAGGSTGGTAAGAALVAQVEATGGSYGGWIPSIGSGGFIEGSGPGILANIAENGGDEYVIPARGVPILKQKQPTVLNMSFSGMDKQNTILPDLAAGLRTLPQVLRNLGNVPIEGGFGFGGGIGRGGRGMGGAPSTYINVEGDLSSEIRLNQILDERDRKLISSLKSAQSRSRRF